MLVPNTPFDLALYTILLVGYGKSTISTGCVFVIHAISFNAPCSRKSVGRFILKSINAFIAFALLKQTISAFILP